VRASLIQMKDKPIPDMYAPKILMIAPGDDIHSLRPLNLLLARGCRIVFSDGVNPFPEDQDGYTYLRFPDPRGRYFLPKHLGKNIGVRLFRCSTWATIHRLKWLWRRIQPTIVHVHWVDDRAYYCLRAGLHPLVLTVWGSDINKHFLPDADPDFRDRIGKALAGADAVIIDSADMHNKCAELAGRDVPTVLLTQGIDSDRFRPGYSQAALEWRQRLGISADATVLVSIRGWSSLYRHDCILEAFARALPRLNSEAILVFKFLKRKGTDPVVLENEMRDLAEKLGVARKIRWMEEVPLEQLPGIYSFADVILNYPSMDAFPVTFLEAAACECPVISCRLPAYEGTFAEEYFRLVDPVDHSELSDAIVEFVNHKSEAINRGLPDLRQTVCRDYDEKFMANQLIGIYQKVSSLYY
jgi:glycosyltransferase involved in cell wall biosynthesis